MAEPIYTAEQLTTAAAELREAAGSDASAREGFDKARYSPEEALQALAGEIRLLRERGFTDERIADLLGGFDIEATAAQVRVIGAPHDWN